jgi:hypothetical protein
MNLECSGERATADKGALALIGLMLAVATVTVMVTAAIAMTDFRGEIVATLPTATSAR